MIDKGKMALLAAVAWLTIQSAVPVAMAGELTWHFRSEHQYAVSLEFYSQDRRHVWPGSDEVYVIRDYDEHEYSLACNSGEKICYGAWVRNETTSYWGSGYNGRESCDSCCFRCDGGDTPVIVLNR